MSKPTITSTEALGRGLVNGGGAPEVLVAQITAPSLAEQRGESQVKTPDPLAARLEQAGDGAPIERHFWDLDENGELILN